MKKQTLSEFSNEMAKSASAERELFQNFLAEYLNASPSQAFQSLYRGSANPRTRLCAEQFNDAILERLFENSSAVIQASQQNSKVKEAAVLQKFFAEYTASKDFSRAYDLAQKEISNDPDLRQDSAFQNRFQKIADEVKPKQRQVKDTNLQEDETVFVKINQGLPNNVDVKVNDARLKQLLTDTLDNFYAAYLPATDKRKQQAALETEAILQRKQVPLALVIAGQDAKKISETVVSEIRRLERNTEDTRNLAQQGVKFRFDWVDVMDAAKFLRQKRQEYTPTEKIDLVRNLIINLNGSVDRLQVKTTLLQAGDFLDDKLVDLLKKHQEDLGKDATVDQKVQFLTEVYQLYWKEDIKPYAADIRAEVTHLMKGGTMAGVDLALKEIQEKEQNRLDAEALNKAVQRMTHGEDHSMQTEHKQESLTTSINNILKKTNLQPGANASTNQNAQGNDQMQDLRLPRN